jgi:His-Xaa-Ser system radical SAM maturase HxsC
MIDLQLRASLEGPHTAPFVVKLLSPDEPTPPTSRPNELAYIGETSDSEVRAETPWGPLIIEAHGAQLEGDVLFVQPEIGIAQRWFRRGATQNTLLITERCDQLCVMCSQPPKKTHTDLFSHFERACMLADAKADIGLSGGEPTLYKAQLLDLVENVCAARADVRFHILTNAQHFERSDIERLRALKDDIVWGVPVYSANPVLHDQIVGKPGAFEQLEVCLAILAEANAAIELRTVVMRQTVAGLPQLARWLSARLPEATCWAIMQLEKHGFAKSRWEEQFFDHSIDFDQIGDAAFLAQARGLKTYLYNFPKCTVPPALRDLCPSTISDWKRDFLPECQTCSAHELCSGLFTWHSHANPYANWGPL